MIKKERAWVGGREELPFPGKLEIGGAKMRGRDEGTEEQGIGNKDEKWKDRYMTSEYQPSLVSRGGRGPDLTKCFVPTGKGTFSFGGTVKEEGRHCSGCSE